METINFNDCTLGFLEKRFQIQKHLSPLLNRWTDSTMSLNAYQQEGIKQLSQILSDNAEHWNEFDLSLHFIGPVFSLVNFTQPYRFNLFAQSTLTGVIDNVNLTGRVDELIASGYRQPETPFLPLTSTNTKPTQTATQPDKP